MSAQGLPKDASNGTAPAIESAFKQFNATQSPNAVKKFEQLGLPAQRQLRARIKSKSRNAFEREMAMALAEKIDDVDATDGLLDVVMDDVETPYLRGRAAASLYKIGRKHDARASHQLEKRFKIEDSLAVRQNILMAVGRVGQKKAIGFLRRHLSEGNADRIKAGAVYGLGAIDDPSIVTILLAGLKDDDTSITMEYARVLARKAKASRAVSRALVEKLRAFRKKEKDRDPLRGAKQRVIFQAIGTMHEPSIIPQLKPFAESTDFLEAFYAAMALGKLGDADAMIPVIERAYATNELSFAKRMERTYREATGKGYSQQKR